MKGKIYKGEILLGILFFVISIASICFTIYMVRSYNIQLLSQGFYSNNAKHIKFKNEPDIRHIKNVSIYVEATNYNFDARYAIVDGKTNIPPLLSGRYFTNDDYNKPVAIVGKNVLAFLKNSNSIDFNGKAYKVIGVMGDQMASKLDNSCFLSLSSDEKLTDKVLIVDSNKKEHVDLFIESLSSEAENNYELLNIEVKGISNWMNMEINSIVFYLAILILFVLNSVAMTDYWLKMRMQHIAVMRLCGYSNLRILVFILNRYLKCMLFGYLSGLLLICPYMLLQADMSILSFLFVISFTMFILLICGLAIAVFPAYQACKIDVMMLIRRAEKNEV